MSTYETTLRTMESLRKRGLKVKVSHLRAYLNLDVNEQIVDILIRNGYDKEARQFKPLLSKTYKTARILREQGIKPEHHLGFTRVIIVDQNGDEFLGESGVSKKDRFNKKIGLQIAFGRALHNLANGEVYIREDVVVH